MTIVFSDGFRTGCIFRNRSALIIAIDQIDPFDGGIESDQGIHGKGFGLSGRGIVDRIGSAVIEVQTGGNLLQKEDFIEASDGGGPGPGIGGTDYFGTQSAVVLRNCILVISGRSDRFDQVEGGSTFQLFDWFMASRWR